MPHYWEHVRWVWGARDMDEFLRIAENVHLDGVLDRIKVPFLVTRGGKLAAPAGLAHRTMSDSSAPKRELKVFTEREGDAERSSFDRSPPTPAPTSPIRSPKRYVGPRARLPVESRR